MNKKTLFWAGFTVAIILVIPSVVLPDTSTLFSVSGGRVLTSHVNQYFNALKQDLVPRNSGGAPTNRAGSLGTSAFRWFKAFIESGYWAAGDVKLHHTFNGLRTCGQGWMLADGQQVTQANYDAQAGYSAGDWATYVVSSPLLNKFTPNMTGRYPVGSATTTQDGSIAITAVGNSGNTVNLQHGHGTHSHTAPDHGHVWLLDGLIAGTDSTLRYTGTSFVTQNFAVKTKNAGPLGIQSCSGSATCLGGAASNNFYTGGALYTAAGSSTSANSVPNALSTTQTIQPDSIQVQYCIRIID
jgi:hypothetical protein